MKLYTVHCKDIYSKDIDNFELVPEGFSLFAAVFQFMWTLYYKMWIPSLILLIVQSLITYFEKNQMINFDTSTMLTLLMLVFVGFNANDWRRNLLIKKGLQIVGVTSGKTLEEAQRNFFDNHFASKKTQFDYHIV